MGNIIIMNKVKLYHRNDALLYMNDNESNFTGQRAVWQYSHIYGYDQGILPVYY